MIISDPIDLRRISSLCWKEPLSGLRDLQFSRPFKAKRDREEYQAALLAYGLQQQAGIFGWQYAMEPDEYSDRDCLLRCIHPDLITTLESEPKLNAHAESSYIYKPVQLKELPPLSPATSKVELQRLIDSFKKYAAQPSMEILVVGVYVNRATMVSAMANRWSCTGRTDRLFRQKSPTSHLLTPTTRSDQSSFHFRLR